MCACVYVRTYVIILNVRICVTAHAYNHAVIVAYSVSVLCSGYISGVVLSKITRKNRCFIFNLPVVNCFKHLRDLSDIWDN